MRRLVLAFVALLSAQAADIPSAPYTAHVRYLASDELKGRATGSPELEQAAAYIAKQFETYGVKPIPGSGYLQEFTAVTGSRPGTNNHLVANRAGGTATFAINAGFTPFSFSSSGSASAVPVVFAGYGITAPDYNYDDYAGIDVTDKFVLILRHEPQENDPKSVFQGAQNTAHSTFVNKAVNAKNHGARGVILINDSFAHPADRDALMSFGQTDGPSDAGLLYVQVAHDTAVDWVSGGGRNLRTVFDAINQTGKPQSFPINGLTVSVDVEVVKQTSKVHNVAAYLPGTTDEYIILGAHYDHLGLGDEHSLAPSEIGKIHHGADDNASGTAGVLELAHWFAGQPRPKRGVLFLTFSGEEEGLLGSSYYANNPILPLNKAVAMLNMDMIGRINNDGKVYVNGTGTGTTLDAVVASVKAPANLKIDLSESTGYGGSDHLSFLSKQVPVLFFFSGLHGDYHKPSDTSDKINSVAATALLGYVADITAALSSDPQRPAFKQVAEPANDPHSTPGGAPVSSGYGPSFGSVPDFNEPPKGVRFADVRAGTPAQKAGLRPGDILIEFDGKEIGNLYDFTYALQAHKPGDEVLVKVLRESQTIEAKVLLTSR